DDALAPLLEAVRATRPAPLLIVTADHGEALGDHGEETHGMFVYEATMRVPLVISPPPAGVAPGTRIRDAVSNVDLAATLLERFGIGRAALPQSRTPLLPTADADPDGDRALYLESITPYYAHRQHPLRAVVWKGMKFIETRRPELYALVDDPTEKVDLIAVKTELRGAFEQRLAGLIAENPPLEWDSEHTRSADDISGLKAIGYAAASARGNPFVDPDLPDAKDRIGDLKIIDQVAALMRDGSMLLGLDGRPRPNLTAEQRAEGQRRGREMLEQARQLIEQLKDVNPKDPMIPVMLSTIHLGLRNFKEAATVIEQVVTEDPRHPINHYNLSHAYSELKRADWSKRELEKAVYLEPRMLYGLRLLAALAIEAKDWPAAACWLDRLETCPGQTEQELANVKRRREQVQAKLAERNLQPAAAPTFTDAELLPEGTRQQ
ncbi:MAG TPA: sulfatase/phosphatase domain-containing protein, partial [Myxococcota bacterium]|nr:sulfatase/phosphatase domain-containing protein [Myxococcota bacterium]